MFKRIAILVCVLSILGSCGMPPGRTGTLTLQVSDGMNRSVMPGISLEADHYSVHGAGTSGQADGATFDLDIPAGQATADVELLPGGWTITATVWNDDDPSVAVGSAAATTTIVVGVPATVNLHVTPYTGPGTLLVDLDWIPDVIAAPGVEAELMAPGGALTAVPMTLESSTAANGTLDIEQGWYTGAVRIYDAGVLNAGIVRAVRIASGATTTWSEFLTVNQLEGGITFDLSWYSGRPLALTTNPASGDVNLYPGALEILAVTGVDNDAGTSVLYAWHLNGELTALGTGSSLTVDGNDFEVGVQYYVSCIAFQSDGKRAGEAQFRLIITYTDLTRAVRGTLTTGIVGIPNVARIVAANKTTTIKSTSWTGTTAPHSWIISDIPVGSYYLLLFADADSDGVFDVATEYRLWWSPTGGSGADAPVFDANVIVPHDAAMMYNALELQ